MFILFACSLFHERMYINWRKKLAKEILYYFEVTKQWRNYGRINRSWEFRTMSIFNEVTTWQVSNANHRTCCSAMKIKHHRLWQVRACCIACQYFIVSVLYPSIFHYWFIDTQVMCYMCWSSIICLLVVYSHVVLCFTMLVFVLDWSPINECDQTGFDQVGHIS